ISTGVVLAWATEAFKKEMISQKDTLGLILDWGDHKTYMKAVELISNRINTFYSILAEGVEQASLKYGGEDFALAFGTNEMPGYHTGPLCYAGYLTGSRHSHLDSAGYSLDQKMLSDKIMSPEDAAKSLLLEESWRQVLSSLVVCYFARKIFNPKIITKTLDIIGLHVSKEELNQLGLEILKKKVIYKEREGFSHEKLHIPKRILEQKTPLGYIDERYLMKTIEYYFNYLK
ncbi:MAG: aldehyde ferredoxin oxidoreductase C-terminal domain-containing protein, partial [Candidatus Hodarchaeota archaeon]